jgi:predicted  nucleic acid-binding Zn-ribbon protein
MHQSLKALLQLQDIDSRIIFLREAREKRPRELEVDRRRLEEKQKLVDSMGQEIRRLKMESDRRELDLKKNEAEIIKLRTALNLAKSNQEYQILKEQIARLEGDNAKIEEEVLKSLGEVDGLEEAKRQSEKEYKGAQAEFQKKVEELNRILRGLADELGTEEKRRGEAARNVPSDHLLLYERVLTRHKDFALARIENQVCQGCFMSVTPQTMNMLLLDRDLSQCRNCLRILYLD